MQYKSDIPGARSYDYITDHEEASHIFDYLYDEEVYALDFETTSLDPADGRVRLSTICGEDCLYILDHDLCGSFESWAGEFAKRKWAVFNSKFEGNWIDYYSNNHSVILYDVGHMRRAKLGGGPLSLKMQAKKDLDIDLVKDEQNSGWGAKILTKTQLDYAAYDGDVTWRLWDKWIEELTPGQFRGFEVINSAWRGTLEMEETGLILDCEYHKKLVKWWTYKHSTAERYLRKWAPESVLKNVRSKPQLTKFFKENILDEEAFKAWPKTGKRGDLNMERDTLRLFAHRAPYPINRWVAALIIYNKMEKYLGTYGQKLIDKQERLGRITTRFNEAQAVTGRYSSSAENLQNIPNNPVVRRSFITPTGRVNKIKLVMADYSSIEVRVLAELAGDRKLLYDAIYGDVHSRSASQIFKIDFDEFAEVIASDGAHVLYQLYKSYRTRAKAFTFQLLYGAGAAALSIALKCTEQEAHAAIEAWASIYPKAYHYRQFIFEKMNHDGFIPIIDGRTIYVFKNDRTMPVAANYPVQGAAASVMYRAVHHTEDALWDSTYRARMAATVHDELLLYADEDHAEPVASLLVGSMVQGWLDIFPDTDTNNLVGKGNKATIGSHWGDKK